jgi:DNA-binding CsgD family transcriptional regulator
LLIYYQQNLKNGGIQMIGTKKIPQRYKIYNASDDPFLTQREAECAAHLLHGLTVRSTAETLGLSRRTVEFYLANIKHKLTCPNNVALIAKIANSDFRETSAAIIKKTHKTT